MSPEPEPPKLPKDTATRKVPPELRDFVDCRGSELTLEPGPVPWLDLPGGLQPEVRVDHGSTAGSVDVTITLSFGLGQVELRLSASVRDGRLEVDTGQVPGDMPGLGNPRQAIEDWVRAFNNWLAHNRKKIGETRLRRGKLTLTKVAEDAAVDDGQGWGTGRKVGAGVAAAVAAVLLIVAGVLLPGRGDDQAGTPAAADEATGDADAAGSADLLGLAEWVRQADPICADHEARADGLPAPTDAASYAAYLEQFRQVFEAEIEEIESLGLPTEGADDVERIREQWRRQLALAAELQAAALSGDAEAFRRLSDEIQAINAELEPVARNLGLSTCAVENAA